MYTRQPVIVERQVRYVGQPVYLRVPEGHRKHWDKHCREYNACGQQVFFVQDGWYNNTYAPRYRDRPTRSTAFDKHAATRIETSQAATSHGTTQEDVHREVRQAGRTSARSTKARTRATASTAIKRRSRPPIAAA